MILELESLENNSLRLESATTTFTATDGRQYKIVELELLENNSWRLESATTTFTAPDEKV